MSRFGGADFQSAGSRLISTLLLTECTRGEPNFPNSQKTRRDFRNRSVDGWTRVKDFRSSTTGRSQNPGTRSRLILTQSDRYAASAPSARRPPGSNRTRPSRCECRAARSSCGRLRSWRWQAGSHGGQEEILLLPLRWIRRRHRYANHPPPARRLQLELSIGRNVQPIRRFPTRSSCWSGRAS